MRSPIEWLLLLMLLPGAARAADDPAAWLAKVTKAPPKPAGAVSSVAFVEGLGDDGFPRFKAIDAKAFNALSWLRAVAPGDAALTMKLNPRPPAKGGGIAAAAGLVLATLAPDAVVTTSGAVWELVVLEKGEPKPLVRRAAPPGSDGAALLGWLRGALGYDGLVLAVEGDLILVGSGVADLEAQKQAVVLAADGVTAAAIIEKVAAKGPFGAFRRVISREGAGQGVAPGARVAHGRSDG